MILANSLAVLGTSAMNGLTPLCLKLSLRVDNLFFIKGGEKINEIFERNLLVGF